MAIDIPNMIKISDAQLQCIEHDIKVFGKRNGIYHTIGSKSACGMCKSHYEGEQVFPIGSVESSIIFISDGISDIESYNRTPFTDGSNMVFQVLLEKLKVNKDSLYMTSLYKCNKACEEDKYVCATNILFYEISAVKPKIVVGLGLDVAKYLFPVFEYKYDVSNIENLRNRKHNLSNLGVNTTYIQTYNTKYLTSHFKELGPKFANDIQVAYKLATI